MKHLKVRRTLRGSAMVVVLVVATAVTAAAVVAVSFSSSVVKKQSAEESNKKDTLVLDGAMNMAKGDLATGKMLPGDTKDFTVGGKTVTVTATDSNINGSVDLSATTGTGASIIKANKTVAAGSGALESLWSFGIASNSGFNWTASSTVTGSVYFRNSISILGGLLSKVTKDYKTVSSFNPLGLLTIQGGIITGIQPKTFPSLSNATYLADADETLTGNQSFNGYDFLTDGKLVYINGDLNLTGKTKKAGCFYVTGNVIINGTQDSDHLMVITPGTITFGSTGSSCVAKGFFYAGTRITISKPLTLTGSIASNAFTVSSTFKITWDKWVADKPANGVALHAPGFYP